MAENTAKDGAGVNNSMNRWRFHDEAGSTGFRVVIGTAWAAVLSAPLVVQGCHEQARAESAQAKRDVTAECKVDAATSGENYYAKTYTAKNGKAFVCEVEDFDGDGRPQLALTQVLER